MLSFKHSARLHFHLNFPREVSYFSRNTRKSNIKSMSAEKGKGSLKLNKTKKPSKKSQFPPSEIYLTVLGNGSCSSSRALYMFTDHGKYLFNCGEGTQRLASEHKMKLSKLGNVFITHKSWENLGGLLGMSLTVHDMGVQELTIHGPPGIDSLYKCTETFIFLPDLDIATRSYSDEVFKDDCMEVCYIPIFKSSHNSDKVMNSKDSDCAADIEPRSKKLRVDEREYDHDITMSFACKGHSKPGRILLEKCVEYGVPIGPLLGDLKNGKDVTLPSGKVVLSKDVVSEEEVCPRFLVVECPSEEFLEPFVNEDKFRLYQEDMSTSASLVIHFTPPEILNTPLYQKWMQRFPSTTCHLILNNDCASLNSLAIHRLQYQLNLLHPRMFTLLQEDENTNAFQPGNVFHAQTLERYYLRPAKGHDRSFGIQIEPKEFVDEAMMSKDFQAQLKELQSNIKAHSISHNNELYPEVSFLGTGSSIPNKARNVSAILVHSSENKCILMDCGEGTYGQLLRLHRAHCKEILLQLSCIFISHMHADHHLGLVRILKERQKLFKSLKKEYEPVCIIGPIGIDFWLKNYFKYIESFTPSYRFSVCSDLEDNIFIKSRNPKQIENCKDILVSTVPVNHCKDAHGVIISSKSNKWKLVYSGDTVPCKRLIEAGKDCSLLIHEATMEDDLASEAAFKRHSTTSEAIKVAEEMNAKYTILTHFSQRYAKVPIFNENFHNRVGCAFDNMKVRPSEFHILPLLIPALNSLFAETIEDLHTRTDKRRKREELMKKMLNDSLTQNKCTVES